MSGELLRSYIDMLDEKNEDASVKWKSEITEAFDEFSNHYNLDGIKEQVMELVNAEIDRQVTEADEEEVTEETEEVTEEDEEQVDEASKEDADDEELKEEDSDEDKDEE